MRSLLRRAVSVLCALACAADFQVSLAAATGFVRAEDRNRDGRPDVWWFYDADGNLVRIASDTNFDGRSDEDEYYVEGALVRREIDRNFDDRVDMVEHFDATTHEHSRSVVDEDFDGTADVLVLLQDDRPVFAKRSDTASRALGSDAYARATARADQEAPGQLVPLTDPFRTDTTIHSFTIAGATIGVLAPTVFPTMPIETTAPTMVACAFHLPSYPRPPTAPVLPRSPRGPPSARLA